MLPPSCTRSRDGHYTGPPRGLNPQHSCSLAETVTIAVGRQVLEAGIATNEGHMDRADGAVTLLADDQLGQALIVGVVGIIDLVAIDEGYHVRVLLDGARFTKVRHHRSFVGTLLEGAVELGERHHRTAELLGQPLERAGDLGDLAGT